MKELYRLADFTIEEGETKNVYGYCRADSKVNANRAFIAMGFTKLAEYPHIFSIEKVNESQMILDLKHANSEIERLKKLMDSINRVSDA